MIPSGTDVPNLHCPNCGEPAAGRYCASCGQRQEPLHIPLQRWFRELVQDQFDLDGRLPRSLRTLLTRPGALATEWKLGRRARYISPVRLYLLASVVMFSAVVVSGWLIEWFADATPAPGSTGLDADAIDQEQNFDAFSEAAFRVAPQVLFLMVPVFALLVRSSYQRVRSLYLEDLVFALSCHSFAFLVFAMTWLVEPEFLEPVGSAAQVGLLAWIPVYLVLALKRVYGGSWLAAGVKGMLLLVSHFILVTGVLVLSATVWLRSQTADTLSAANELYRDAFSARSRGDSIAERRHRTEAIAAYRRLSALQYSPHLRYHLARLLMFNAEPASALTVAREGLVAEPDHLLLLGIGMDAARAAKSDSLASALGAHLLAMSQLDSTRPRPEYAGHAAELRALREAAQRARQ